MSWGCTKNNEPDLNSVTPDPDTQSQYFGDKKLHDQKFPIKDEKFKEKETGFLFKDIVVGTGQSPQKGDFALIHYSAWTYSGKKLLSTFGDDHIMKHMNGVGRFAWTELLKKKQDQDGYLLHWLPFMNPESIPVQYLVGCGWGIKGFDVSVRDMKPGGKRIVVIPPRLAYGDDGHVSMGKSVKPNERLVFAIEMFKVESSPWHKRMCD